MQAITSCHAGSSISHHINLIKYIFIAIYPVGYRDTKSYGDHGLRGRAGVAGDMDVVTATDPEAPRRQTTNIFQSDLARIKGAQ